MAQKQGGRREWRGDTQKARQGNGNEANERTEMEEVKSGTE